MGSVQGRYEGAQVDITLERKGDEIYMTAVATAKNGTVYKEMYHQTIGQDVIRVFLIADHSYLKLDASGCTVSEPAKVETTEIGTSDCSAAWWTSFSDYFQIPAGKTLNLHSKIILRVLATGTTGTSVLLQTMIVTLAIMPSTL
mgnify:CR=1 FL=1